MRILDNGQVEISNKYTGETKVIHYSELPRYNIAISKYLDELEAQKIVESGLTPQEYTKQLAQEYKEPTEAEKKQTTLQEIGTETTSPIKNVLQKYSSQLSPQDILTEVGIKRGKKVEYSEVEDLLTEDILNSIYGIDATFKKKRNALKATTPYLNDLVKYALEGETGVSGFLKNLFGGVPGVESKAEMLNKTNKAFIKQIAFALGTGETRATDQDVINWLGGVPGVNDTLNERKTKLKSIKNQIDQQAAMYGIKINWSPQWDLDNTATQKQNLIRKYGGY